MGGLTMAQKVIMKTELAPKIVQYVQFMRERFERKFSVEETMLKAYDNFCFDNCISPLLSQDGFEKYCMSGNVTLCQRGKRYRILYNFYNYCRAYDTTLPEIAAQIVEAKRHKHIAYVYSDDDIAALMSADQNYDKWDLFTSVRWKCIVGMLLCTGLRISELLALKMSDLDFQRKILTVRNTKFRKNRLVPIHGSVCTALRKWLSLRPNQQLEQVFQTRRGRILLYGEFNRIFNKVIRRLGLGETGKPKPRIHDLRHTFAIRKVVEWQKKGVPVQIHLQYLSTYMGHVHYDNTTYYLDSSEQLLANVLEKFKPIEE